MRATHRVVASLTGAVLLVAVGVAGVFWFFAQTERAAAFRAQSVGIVREADELLSALKDAETGQRGFLLTGDETFLQPYLAVRDSLTGRLRALSGRAIGGASRAHLDAMAPLLAAKLSGMATLVAMRRGHDEAGALARVRSGTGRALMDSIRSEMRAFITLEDAELARHAAAYDTGMRRLLTLLIVASAAALFLALLFGFSIHRRSQQQIENRVNLETQRLLRAQEETTAQLQRVNRTLSASEERLAVTLNSIGDAVMTTDAEARVVLMNRVAEALTGWTGAEAAGHAVGDVMRIISKESREPATLPVMDALAHGTIQGLANHMVLVARDGSERDIADSCAPIRDLDGAVIGAVLVFRDVTTQYAAQQALKDSGALIASVLNTATDGIITFHASGGLVATVNPAAERIFGYSAAEMVGRDFSLLIPELDQHQRENALEYYTPSDEARAKGLGREVMGRGKNGNLVPIEIAVSEMVLRGQRYFTASVRDISLRRLAESATFEAGALQRAIFDSASFSSIATDAKGVIQIFNVGAERMLGYAASEVVNRITPAEMSDPEEVIVRAQALSVELGTPIAPGFEALVFKASRGIEDIYELTYTRKDGSRLPALVSVTALRDAQEAIIGYLLIGTDNTTRKLAEAEQQLLDQRLRDQQFYTRSLVESNIDAVMTTDPRGIITDVNKEAELLTGCTRDELIGAPFKLFFTDVEKAEAGIKQVLRGTKITNYELTARARNGKETVVSCNATTFYDRNRTLQGVFASARDVTERKRVEGELEHAKALADSANRTKSDFLASMSHEIRTPMNAIMGIAELLAKTPLSPEQDKYVQIFRRAGDNLLNLINDILDLSKVEASQLEIEHTGFSLSDLTSRLMEMVAPRAQEKRLTLECEIAPNVPTDLIGDPTRIRQVLLNLVGNAIKFTVTGGVSLRITRDEGAPVPGTLRFTITDSGIGIPSPTLARIFERFTQADSSVTRRFGGSGLGLTISKRLVEAMGGQIRVESTVGQGSTFAFSIPFEIWAGTIRREAAPLSRGAEPPLPALRILMAEDSPDNAVITVAYLEDTPYEVDIAENGAVACDKFATGHYDLVLMDWQMPIMDGMTATQRIRQWERATGRLPTPIIALTASALKGDREKCLTAGCTGFLTKPIKQDVLLQAIKDRANVEPSSSTIDGTRAAQHSVRASPKLAARIPIFLRNRRQDVVTMLDALSLGDFKTVQRLGHNMRGTGSGYGFQAITDIGAAIEREAGNADVDAARQSVDELSTYLDGVGLDGAFTE